jgi:hypothetical protein
MLRFHWLPQHPHYLRALLAAPGSEIPALGLARWRRRAGGRQARRGWRDRSPPPEPSIAGQAGGYALPSNPM